jgi:hypothetical protein
MAIYNVQFAGNLENQFGATSWQSRFYKDCIDSLQDCDKAIVAQKITEYLDKNRLVANVPQINKLASDIVKELTASTLAAPAKPGEELSRAATAENVQRTENKNITGAKDNLVALRNEKELYRILFGKNNPSLTELEGMDTEIQNAISTRPPRINHERLAEALAFVGRSIADNIDDVFADNMAAIVTAYAKTCTPPINDKQIIDVIRGNLASVTESARNNPEELEIFSNLLQCGTVVIDAMLEKVTEPQCSSVAIIRDGVYKALFEGKDLSEIMDILGKGYILPKEVYNALKPLLDKYPDFRDTIIRIAVGIATKEEIDALIKKYPEAQDDIIALKKTRTDALAKIDPSTLNEEDRRLLDQEADNDQAIANYFNGMPGMEGLADAFGRAAAAARDLSNTIGQMLQNNSAPGLNPTALASPNASNPELSSPVPPPDSNSFPSSPLNATAAEKQKAELSEARRDEEKELANAEAAKEEFSKNLDKTTSANKESIAAIEQQAQASKAIIDALENALLTSPLLTNPDNAAILSDPVISAKIEAITETINTMRAANTQSLADLSQIMRDTSEQVASGNPAEASKVVLDQIEQRRAETAEKMQTVRQILAAIPDKGMDAILDSVAVDLPREALKLLAALLASLKEIERVAGVNLEQAKAELEKLLIFAPADKLSEAYTVERLFDERIKRQNEPPLGTLADQQERINCQNEILDILTAQGMEYTLDRNAWSKFVRDMVTVAGELEVTLGKINQDYPVKDAVKQQTARLNDIKEKLYGGEIAEVLQKTDLTDKEKEVVKRALTRQLADKPIAELMRLAAVAADPEIKAFIQQIAKDAEEQEKERQEEKLGLKSGSESKLKPEPAMAY